MPENPRRPITLSLSRAEQWTLHHVLLERIEQEATAAEPSRIAPPPIEVFQAFERLDAGDPTFTVAQLEAIQSLLAASHHSPAWELERVHLEQLLHRVTASIERYHASVAAD